MGASEEQSDETDADDRARWYEWFDPSPTEQAIPVGPPVDTDEVQRELRDPHPFTPHVGQDEPMQRATGDRIYQAARERVPFIPDRNRPYAGLDKHWFKSPKDIARVLSRVAFWTFVPHQKNAATRKILTLFLMLTWSTLTIGQAFGMAEVGEIYYVVTVIVFTIVSQIWGIELGAISAIATADTPEQADTMREKLPEEKYEYTHRPGRIPSRRPHRTENPRRDNHRPDRDPEMEDNRETERELREEDRDTETDTQ